MKFAMLSTGGTIASVDSDKGLRPDSLNVQRLVEICPALMGFEHDIDFISVMSKDSSDMQPCDWLAMAENIKSVKSDAVILLHGTDTLAYTASALAYLLNNLNVPVVITGAMLAPQAVGVRRETEVGSDAGDNIYDAVQFAMQLAMYGRKGVYVAFGGVLIHGLRAYKADSRHVKAFISVDYPVLGEMKDKGGHKIAWLGSKVPAFTPKRPWPDNFNFVNSKIITLPVFPGLSAAVIDKVCELEPRAIILEGYGLGGAPENLLSAIKNCVANNISVIVRTQTLFGGVDLSIYEVGRRLLDVGAVPALNATCDSLIAKLTLLFASDTFSVNNLNLNICDDII
ncbi:MAG: asparaginase [Synergistaceae bacterium]|nr:asparaginase [Synergistaceae bacterium]